MAETLDPKDAQPRGFGNGGPEHEPPKANKPITKEDLDKARSGPDDLEVKK